MARRETEAISVSFLDLFACAIGAVLFIIIILFLNTLQLVPKDQEEAYSGMESRLKAEEKESRRRQEKMERLEREGRADESELPERRRVVEDLRARTAALPSTSDTAALAAKVEEKSRRLTDLEARREELRAALQAERQSVREVEMTLNKALGKDGSITYRIPYEHVTQRESGPWLECAGDRVFLFSPDNYLMKEYVLTNDRVDRFKNWMNSLSNSYISNIAESEWKRGEAILIEQALACTMNGATLEPRRTHEMGFGLNAFTYLGMSYTRLGFLVSLERKNSVAGETAKSLRETQNGLRKLLAAGNAKAQFVTFYVRPDGYASFRDAKEVVESLGYEVTWRYYAAEIKKFRFTLGSGEATVK